MISFHYTSSLTIWIGLSSNHAFFRSISRCFIRFLRGAPQQHDQTQPETTEDWSEINTSRINPTSKLKHNSEETLPTISESFSMLDRFIATSAGAFPFVSKATLTAPLKELVSGSRKPGWTTKRALVNIMFAYSCLAIEDPKCDVYFQRTIQYLTPETLRGASSELSELLLSRFFIKY